jgi:hypothetical protein
MNPDENPLLQPEDYRAGYNESIDKLKNQPELISFDKLCYEHFHISEMGKKFMEIVIERWLIPPLADRNHPNFETHAVWAEGFKDFPRMIRSAVLSHQQRIKAETNKNDR